MTRRITLQLAAIVSDDGTRCAAECPHRSSPCGIACMAFGVADDSNMIRYWRHPACIAAEQAAASVPSWQPIETAPKDGTKVWLYYVPAFEGATWTGGTTESRYGEWRDEWSEEVYANGWLLNGDPWPDAWRTTHWMPLPEAPGVPASAQSGHLDGGARALDASEALREARVQGMREGLSITKGHARAVRTRYHIEVDYEDADEAIDAAIEAVRKGER